MWLAPISGPPVPGHALAYDQETGFGLVQALARMDLPALEIGNSGRASIGERVVVAGAGGLHRSVAARIVAKQEFAGYWEYVLDEAIFTAPSHPNWGGTAVIGPAGDLIGIGSLQLEQGREKGSGGHLNMVVPIDLLKPILDDLLRHGRPNRPARPWLGFYAAEIEAGSSSSASPIAARPNARACRPATWCWRSPAKRRATSPPCSAASGRWATPASKSRCGSSATAAASIRRSPRRNATGSSRSRGCTEVRRQADGSTDARRRDAGTWSEHASTTEPR